MKKVKKIALICVGTVLLWFLIVFAVYHLFIKNRSNIDLAEYGYVTDYLHRTYGGHYTLHRGRFVQYDYGITGGMFQYYFYVSDEKDREYVAHYCTMAPISEENLNTLIFEAVKV
ncbi:MAG: hypothetical protein IK130_08605 [Oscillospiraceae bacterium]|nr:hypothetical protein [Oscillospiraceae bacterium]